MINEHKIRNDFPILSRPIDGKPLIYLDSTATSLKPQSVLDSMNDYYSEYGANVFRGIYKISERATAAYEGARSKIANFIGVKDIGEVIFTRSTDESISLVYYSWALEQMQEGDEVVTTIMEHHSNFVPWQQLMSKRGTKLKIWNVDQNGQLNLNDLDTLITRRTKLLAITAASNVLGTLTPISEIINIVKRINPDCLVLVDAAQAAPHIAMNVHTWGADFVAFSSHKMLGPTGMGILWARKALLDAMPPFNFGGDMIKSVYVDQTEFQDSPHKFEAGTPNIAGAIGFGAAIDYLSKIGMDMVRQHELDITEYAIATLSRIPGILITGSLDASKRGGVIAFTIKGIHPHDIAQLLDEDNICIRVGFHCAQPLHDFLACGPTARASFYIYTTKDDVNALATGLEKVITTFA